MLVPLLILGGLVAGVGYLAVARAAQQRPVDVATGDPVVVPVPVVGVPPVQVPIPQSIDPPFEGSPPPDPAEVARLRAEADRAAAFARVVSGTYTTDDWIAAGSPTSREVLAAQVGAARAEELLAHAGRLGVDLAGNVPFLAVLLDVAQRVGILDTRALLDQAVAEARAKGVIVSSELATWDRAIVDAGTGFGAEVARLLEKAAPVAPAPEPLAPVVAAPVAPAPEPFIHLGRPVDEAERALLALWPELASPVHRPPPAPVPVPPPRTGATGGDYSGPVLLF